MPAQKYSDDLINRAAMMREKGYSCGQIAAKLGMTKASVQAHCLKLGAEVPNAAFIERPPRPPINTMRGGRLVRQFTPAEDAQLLALDLQGLTLTEMAKAMGRQRNSIRARLQTLARHQDRAEQRANVEAIARLRAA